MSPSEAEQTFKGQQATICSGSPLAAEVGLDVLRQGGNAFDACVAVAATETVTLPAFCSLGGDVFALLYHAQSGKCYGVTGSGRGPYAATAQQFRDKGHQAMPRRGVLSVNLPGEVHAYKSILERFGSGRWSFQRLLEPAIRYAEDGVPLYQRHSRLFSQNAEELGGFPTTAQTFLVDGRPYQSGETLTRKALAGTLKRLAREGPDDFYQGGIAKALVNDLREEGSLYIDKDFSSHQSVLYDDPIATTYRGDSVYETRLPSQGQLVLQMLNLIEGFDVASLGLNSADYIHLLTEAKKLAYADRSKYFGDPEVGHVPVDELLSKEYAEGRRSLIDMEKAADRVEAGVVQPTSEAAASTCLFCIADAEGNIITFIHSLFGHFGSFYTSPSTGILMNNRASWFSLLEGHPNELTPGKRPIHTLNCYMVMRDGHPYVTGGTAGGDSQPQWNVQNLTRVLDFKLDVQQATELPRFSSAQGQGAPPSDAPFELVMEEELLEDRALVEELERRGHSVTSPSKRYVGSASAQMILVDPVSGTKKGGSDPREDGRPMGY